MFASFSVLTAVAVLLGVRHVDAVRGWALSPRTPGLVAAGLVRGVPLLAVVGLFVSGLPGLAFAHVIVAASGILA